jgi:hypothetical protein
LSEVSRCLLLVLFGHAAITELSLLSEVKRKLDLEPANGSFWREAAIQAAKEGHVLLCSDRDFIGRETRNRQRDLVTVFR